MTRQDYGIIVMLDALGASGFGIEQAVDFIQKRDNLLERLNKLETEIPVQPTVATFGDTIVVMWPTGRDDVMKVLPSVAEWLRPAILWGIERGILLRGCVSVGEYIANGATVLGPAIGDAAKWYDEADWFGVILTPNCQMYLITLLEIAKLDPDMRDITFEQWFVQYPVPLKDSVKDLWVISWPYSLFAKDNGIVTTPLGTLSYFLKDFPIPLGTEAKYENTIAFFNWYGKTICPKMINKRKHTKKS